MNSTEQKIEFNLLKVLQCISHISEVSNVVTAIYHSTKEYSAEDFITLDTDGIGFVFPNDKGEVVVTSDMIHQWVFRKAFEDFIIGLSQSLIETCRLLELYTLAIASKQMPFQDKESMEMAVDKILISYTKSHFPNMLDVIEKRLGVPLPFKKEILSINTVRNCLVHRNAIVSEDDINEPSYASLVLQYLDLEIYIQVAGKLVLLTAEEKKRKNEIEGILTSNACKSISFSLGQKVQFTADIFKSVTYTSIVFIQEIIKLLPIPNEIKTTLIQDFVLNIAGDQKV